MSDLFQVGWEIFSYQLAAVGILPPIMDMFFIAFVPPEVPEEPGLRRKGTGTPAYRFDGCEGEIVMYSEKINHELYACLTDMTNIYFSLLTME